MCDLGYGQIGFHAYYLQYVEHHSFDRSQKSLPYYIVTEKVLKAVKTAVDLIGGIERYVPSEGSVFIKPPLRYFVRL